MEPLCLLLDSIPFPQGPHPWTSRTCTSTYQSVQVIRFLRFYYKETMHMVTVLPFGLSTSSSVFTRIRAVGQSFENKESWFSCTWTTGLWWVVSGKSIQGNKLSRAVSSDLRFIVNKEKLHPLPTQTPTFLGAVLGPN